MPVLPLSYAEIAADLTARIRVGEYGPLFRPAPVRRRKQR